MHKRYLYNNKRPCHLISPQIMRINNEIYFRNKYPWHFGAATNHENRTYFRDKRSCRFAAPRIMKINNDVYFRDNKNKNPLSSMCLSVMIVMMMIILPCLISGHAIADENSAFPFYPSLIIPAADGGIGLDAFKAAMSCRGCHLSTFKEWEGSTHSLAFKDPVFLSMCRLGSKATNGQTDKLCLGCHTPIGLITSDITTPDDETKANQISKDGVQCDFCHVVSNTTYNKAKTASPQNASFLVQPGEIKWGPIDNCESTFHKSEFSELHTSSKFCGNCHNIFLTGQDIKIVKTYDEWEKSVYAQKGIECQDCHMMPVELAKIAADKLEKPKNSGKAASVAPLRENIHVHRFVGGGFDLEKGPRVTNQQKETEKRLKSAARLDIDVKPSPSSKGSLVLTVTVHNERAGHNLPTGIPGIRQLWLEVIISDKGSKEVFRSGGLDKDGNIQKDAKRLGVAAVDKSGDPVYKPWEIAALKTDTTIPPKGKGGFKFDVSLPDDIAWPMTAKAILHYRAFSPSLLKDLLPDAPREIPVFDMATSEIAIQGPVL
ncbi:hypothetical protein JXL19_04230 [bacterium]|nr:hypothetical protein [bacterium]